MPILEADLEGKESTLAWYALHTRYQHEKNIARALASKGFEVLLPLYTTVHRWRDRNKQLLLPLFPCYVFLKTHLDRWQPILATPGIHHVVGFGGHPSIIPSSEIEAVQRMVEGPFKTEPTRFWNAAIESDSKPVHCRDWKGYCSARKAYGSWSFRLRCCKDRWP